MEESWRREWKVVRKWNVTVWKGILFLFSVSWHHLTLLQTHWASVSLKSFPVWFVFVYVLTACVFVTQDTVRHPRRFVFGKFVRKPNCSWSEAFVNRGLTVLVITAGEGKNYRIMDSMVDKNKNGKLTFLSNSLACTVRLECVAPHDEAKSWWFYHSELLSIPKKE